MYVSIPATSHLDRKMSKRSPRIVACSMLSFSEEDRKSQRATSGISCELLIPPLSLPDPAWNRLSRLGWNIISKATAKNVCFPSYPSHLDRKMPKRSPKIGMKYHFETLSVKIPKSFCIRYPDNSLPGQFAPDNSPPIFKQLVLRSVIHYRTNSFSFFFPLPSQ